jgi:polysaccharide biosynthesis transport protein
MDGEAIEVRPFYKRRWFRIFGAAILLASAASLITWCVWPNRVTATALFLVGTSDNSHLADATQPSITEYEFEGVKKTQLALLRSDFVLTAALRDPDIGSLPAIQRHSEPVEWLQNNLVVEYPENGRLLAIRLKGPESEREDLVRIVDAIAKAYRNEVIDQERQERLVTRDLLSRSLGNVNGEIKRKLDEYLDIARESGRQEAGSGQVLQQLDTKRLDRVENQLMQLENQLTMEPKKDQQKGKLIETRISQLKSRQTELEKLLTRRAEKSADLETRRQDIDQLQSISNEMSIKLQRLDIAANSPDRIRQVQPAMISPLASRFPSAEPVASSQ